MNVAALTACGPGESAPDAAGEGAPAPDQRKNSSPAPVESSRNSDFSGLPAPYSEASYSLGRRIFKNCGSCHTLREGGQNLVGPNLHGIIGRQAGSLEGFNYSSALEEADFVWTAERLEEWLSNPRTFLPGNNMTFSGVHRPDDRHAVIAYVMSETSYDAKTNGEDEGDLARTQP